MAGTVEAQRRTFLARASGAHGRPEPGKAWTNSLGMLLVPIGNVRFCAWETRVKDYAAFCSATSRTAPQPDFPQSPDDPVVMVNWDDAMEFCRWLTDKERAQSSIGEKQHYRLPTDAEMERGQPACPRGRRHAGKPRRPAPRLVSLGHRLARHPREPATTPTNPSNPPATARALAASAERLRPRPHLPDISPPTPSGSLTSEAMSGNGALKDIRANTPLRDWGVLRADLGPTAKKSELESSYRNVVDRSDRDVIYGFRCVLAEEE